MERAIKRSIGWILRHEPVNFIEMRNIFLNLFVFSVEMIFTDTFILLLDTSRKLGKKINC